MDYFYAQLEEQRNPRLKEKVVAVCMITPQGGAISTVNYKGRKLGLKSGMPLNQAKKIAPDAEYLKVDKLYYATISAEIDEYIRTIVKQVVQVSIDEWNCIGDEKAAKKIKEGILKNFGLTCTVAVSPSVLGAKMAAKTVKPNGFIVLDTQQEKELILNSNVKRIPGIGSKTAAILKQLGIETLKDIQKTDIGELHTILGKKTTNKLVQLSRGEFPKELGKEKEVNEISRLATLEQNTRDLELIYNKIMELEADLKKRLSLLNKSYQTITIILISSDYQMITKSFTYKAPRTKISKTEKEVERLIKEGLKQTEKNIRRVGIKFGNLKNWEGQTTLF